MMKRGMFIFAMLVCGAVLISGCRALDSTYATPEADVSLLTNYGKDTTTCETPKNVKVARNKGAIFNSTGWAASLDGNTVTIAASKKGKHSATIMIQRIAADKSVATLSFTVKQTGDNDFSACDFKYKVGKERPHETVTGTIFVDQVNLVDEKDNLVINSGSFDLTFSHGSDVTATKVQSIYLGATSPNVVRASDPNLNGTYFIDWVNESVAK